MADYGIKGDDMAIVEGDTIGSMFNQVETMLDSLEKEIVVLRERISPITTNRPTMNISDAGMKSPTEDDRGDSEMFNQAIRIQAHIGTLMDLVITTRLAVQL